MGTLNSFKDALITFSIFFFFFSSMLSQASVVVVPCTMHHLLLIHLPLIYLTLPPVFPFSAGLTIFVGSFSFCLSLVCCGETTKRRKGRLTSIRWLGATVRLRCFLGPRAMVGVLFSRSTRQERLVRRG